MVPAATVTSPLYLPYGGIKHNAMLSKLFECFSCTKQQKCVHASVASGHNPQEDDNLDTTPAYVVGACYRVELGQFHPSSAGDALG